MDSRQCAFLPPGAIPQICHSALPRASNQASTFIYRPLNKSKSEIRVLCPHTAAGYLIQKLEFTIRTVSMNDKPKYWALSYVWGDPNDTEPICIEGQTFMVTRNLRDALKRVRNIMTKETMDLQLWIDAICINQADPTEKGWQVDIMARIYSEAYHMNVWLGEADHNVLLAMEFVSAVGSPQFTERHPLTDENFASICAVFIAGTLKQEGGDDLELVLALENIFHHREYWKRAWTFQEFCLSGSVIWCGDSWFSLGTALNFVNRSKDIANRVRAPSMVAATISPEIVKFIECIGDIGVVLTDRIKAGAFKKNIGEFGLKYNEVEKLGILLCQSMSRQASEPKDKVYSLLGLCNVNITPDYSDTLSVAQLYQDTSTLLWKEVKDTELLTVLIGFAGLSSQSHLREMPSWAVEWDVVAKARVNFKIIGAASNKEFIAKYPPLQFLNLGIIFQAIIIDEVQDAYTPQYKRLHEPGAPELLKFFFNNLPMNVLPYVVKHQPRYRTGISLLTAVLSTLLLGRDVLSGNDYDPLFVDKRPCENFKKIAKIFLRMIDLWKCAGPFNLSLEAYLEMCRQESSQGRIRSGARDAIVDQTIDRIFGFENGVLTHEDVLEACSQIIPHAVALKFYNKAPFGARAKQMTALKSKEGYVGAGRAGVAPQDLICVLRDTSIPFILRPMGEKFALVSPCYVEGLMDGQAWEMVQAGEKSVRTVAVL